MNRAIDTWDGPGYLAPFARSDSLVFIGSDSTEVTIGYDALAEEILPSFASARERGRSGAYRQAGLRTGATRDGRFGWWLQEMEYEFEREGERRVYPFRISGFAVRDSAALRFAPTPGRGGEKRGLPFRTTGAAIRQEGVWKVVEWHADVPVPNDSTFFFSRPVAPADAR